MSCIINCSTNICQICGRKSPSCQVKRNCIGPQKEPQEIKQAAKTKSGPGTELKKLLSKVGISADSGCKCRDRAIYMDRMEIKEPGWCEKNIDTIVGWLEEEAKKRGLPFIRSIGKMLVKRAIKNSQQS